MRVVLCHLITPSMSYDSTLDGLKWLHQLSPSIKGPSDEQYLHCKQSLSISGKQTETITCHFYYMTVYIWQQSELDHFFTFDIPFLT